MLSGKNCPNCKAETHLVGDHCVEVCVKCRRQVKAWTVAEVKEKLPTVKVYLESSGITCTGQIYGRLNGFATVTFAGYGQAEFAWGTIVDCLNRGVPLRV